MLLTEGPCGNDRSDRDRNPSRNFYRNPCLDPDFWINQWEQVEKLARTGLSREFVKAKRWDKLSKECSRRWNPSVEDPVRDAMISLLKGRNILREGVKILDLGCGTGRFAIPFAQAGAFVTAVDVSEGMLACLKEETPADIASRITALQLDWQTADLDQSGFRSGFDISFAHMNPAISGPETFLKFLATSRQWCVLAIWSGERRQNTMEAVWRHLSGKELDRSAGDITFPFNLLYSMGYRPCVEFQDHRYESLVDPETEADQLFDLLHEHRECAEGVGGVEGDEEEIRQRILSVLQDMVRQQSQEGERRGQECRGCREGQSGREEQGEDAGQGENAGMEGQGGHRGQDGGEDQTTLQNRQRMINKVLTGCVARMVWRVDRSDGAKSPPEGR